LRIRPSRHVAGQLGRYVSVIVAKVREAFDDAEEPGELVIDLSQAIELPQAQLTLLLNLLRPAVGYGTVITLSDVRPMVLGSLVGFDLPDGVVVVDTRGRTWTSAVTTTR
jgi:ABC-type transporter Mla MlaB component